jgi:hypothetical protein
MLLVGKTVSASTKVLTGLEFVTTKPVVFAAGFVDFMSNVTYQD